MRLRRLVTGAAVLATGVLVAVLLLPSSSGAATTGQVTLPAASFAFRTVSEHGACAGPVVGEENNGTLSNARGSYFAAFVLPEGATITRLTYLVRDFSGGNPGTDDENSHVYLVRKGFGAGFGAYTVLAEAHSTGFDPDVRVFADSTISTPVVNTLQGYYAEIVNCDNTIEPVAVRVIYSVP